MKKNKIVVIILIIFLILAIAGGVFAYLFINTDIFKSSRELFSKYFKQDLEMFEEMTSFETIKIYNNLQNENAYNSSTNIKTIYSEGGEISNPLNNLFAKLDIQKDSKQNYFYANGQILLKEEDIVEEQPVIQDNEYLQAEIIKQEEQYGIRFTDVVKQFVTVNNDENLENIVNEIGLDINLLKTIINIIDGNETIISEEQINEIKNKYLNIIISEISNGVFEKQRNAIITYNNVTTKTNAYSVSLTNKQVQNILLQILNNIKTETDILDKVSLKEFRRLFITYHEMDERHLIDYLNDRLKVKSKLKEMRLKRNLSQSQLAYLSDVNIRNIKTYEQNENDINKAQVNILLSLARVLNCSIEDILN